MPEEDVFNCPICSWVLDVYRVGPTKDGNAAYDGAYCDCPRCGCFFIERGAQMQARRDKPDSLLSAWIRQRKEEGLPKPEITSNTLENIIDSLLRYSPHRKQLIIMKHMNSLSGRIPGKEVKYDLEIDYPLMWLESADEFSYLLDVLKERNLIRVQGEAKTPTVRIEADGWDFIEAHAQENILTDQAFIAMSFNEEFDEIWKGGIEPAVQAAGYKPLRIDKELFIGHIDATIFNEIRQSRYLIAEVTEMNPGVYYEAGYALGLDIPVIWCVRKEVLDKKQIHFDTRQMRHIAWTNSGDLKEQLFELIDFVIGRRS